MNLSRDWYKRITKWRHKYRVLYLTCSRRKCVRLRRRWRNTRTNATTIRSGCRWKRCDARKWVCPPASSLFLFSIIKKKFHFVEWTISLLQPSGFFCFITIIRKFFGIFDRGFWRVSPVCVKVWQTPVRAGVSGIGIDRACQAARSSSWVSRARSRQQTCGEGHCRWLLLLSLEHRILFTRATASNIHSIRHFALPSFFCSFYSLLQNSDSLEIRRASIR